MNLDRANLEKIAKLARIKLQDQEYSALAESLTEILNWVEQLNSVDTENIEPMFAVHLESMPLREDQITDGNRSSAILENAPEKEFDMFAVPKVIE